MTTLRHHHLPPVTWPQGLRRPLHVQRWAPIVLLVVIVAAALLLARDQFSTPAIVPASAAPTQFSAERAYAQLQVVAQAPRPMGSAASAAVRSYLVEQLTALGLQPEIQTTTARQTMPGMDSVWAGTVHNIVARIPGTANTKAILLGAHYDSVPTSPAAADCGTCVVTLLETARALRAGPALRNDVILVFQDGEEHDMLGSRAFAEEHPWAADAGLALNFEAQGSTGPVLMYITGANNGGAVDGFLNAAPQPLAYSWIADIGRPLGFMMDLDHFTEHGSAGLGFAFLGDAHSYHTSSDNLQALSLHSLQHDGSYALALTRYFGDRDLSGGRLHGSNPVYFNVAGGLIAHYPGGVVLPLAGLITALFAAVLVLGGRRRQFSGTGLAAGVGVALLGLIGAVLMATVIWSLIRRFDADLHVLVVGTYQAELFLLGFAALTAAVSGALYAALRNRIAPANLWAGALVWWWLLLVLTSIAAPGFSYLFAWPLLAGLVALGWSVFRPSQQSRTWSFVGMSAIRLIPALLILVPAIYLIAVLAARAEGQLAIPLIGVPVFFVALAAGLLVPFFSRLAGSRRWLVPAAAALAAVVVLGLAVQRSEFSTHQPKPTMAAYVLDADTGQASWFTANDTRWSGNRAGELDTWTRQFFTAGAQPSRFRFAPSEYPDETFLAYQAAAPAVALPAPQATLQSDTVDGDLRTMAFGITSPRGATNLEVQLEAQGRVEAAAVNGKPIDLGALPAGHRDRLRLQYYGIPQEGFELSVTVRSPAPVQLTLEDRSLGLPTVPGMTIQPRPAWMMTAMTEMTDSTTVRRTLSFGR